LPTRSRSPQTSFRGFAPAHVPDCRIAFGLFGSQVMPALAAWSAWTAFPPSFAPDDSTLAEILDGGQAFRWYGPTEHGVWSGSWGDTFAEVRRHPSGVLEWRAVTADARDPAAAVHRYFALDQDWAGWMDRLPWRSDAHLARCQAAFPHLRLLRQPFGETLLGFLCSATKQILQIKQMMRLLAERHGEPVAPGIHRLPTWDALARVPEGELRRCLLGFRARYIHETALRLQAEPDWLAVTEAAPYAVAKERLCSLPGVGEKVADCVLLFGAGQLEAFPVDVWILRALSDRYGLQGWSPAQVARFGRAHFGPHAGLAQQFVFAWERRHGKAFPPDAATART